MVYERVSNKTFDSRAFLVTGGAHGLLYNISGSVVLCEELISASTLLLPVSRIARRLCFPYHIEQGLAV
jgi:hypothetical protein